MIRLSQKQMDEIKWSLIISVLAFLGGFLYSVLTNAAEIPRRCLQYRSDLTREARLVQGLSSPVPVYAAQMHQESGCNPQATSPVGAIGMAQFMPGTADWIGGIDPALANPQPTNPRWAMRALVRYDTWLLDRVRSDGEYGLYWAMLRSYNGGLGHWQAEAKLAGSARRDQVDGACGKAKRSPKHCPENLDYPRRILNLLQPLYRGWGRMVTM